MSKRNGNREAGKPKQNEAKPVQPASISTLEAKSVLPGKRRLGERARSLFF